MSDFWVATYAGKRFDLKEPEAGDVDVRDIARALSMMCRFNGHTSKFYSVAQHSVMVSRFVPEALAPWGLMHDAAEAYVQDIVRPLKRLLPAYADIEERVLGVIGERFGFRLPMPPEVKEVDNRMVLTEGAQLGFDTSGWNVPAEPYTFRLTPRAPLEAEVMFFRRFEELTAESWRAAS